MANHKVMMALICLGALFVASCQDTEPKATAKRVATRTELIGGPSALGEVGDFILENEFIRAVVQDKGFSRGFGVHGGSLIDIDRVRATQAGDTAGGRGADQFGELFPIAFLQALVPDSVEVLNDGHDGSEAQVRVSGTGGDFFTLTKALNQAILSSHELPDDINQALNVDGLDGEPTIRYDVTYGLAPGDRHLRITVRMTNISEQALKIPSSTGELALSILGVSPDQFQAPLGMVLLFGAGNRVFTPGVGYGVRFALDDAYLAGSDLPFPALPGILTPGLISTSTNGISYGLFASGDPSTPNFVKSRVDADGNNLYEQAYGETVGDDTMLVPFLASAFTGLFYAQTPNEFEAGEHIEFTTYFVVGDGDAASVLDVAYTLQDKKTGLLTGRVTDSFTAEPVAGASVLVYGDNGRPVSQFFSDATGRIKGSLLPGRYTARVQLTPLLSEPVAFELEAGESEHLVLAAPTPGQVVINVRDDSGRLLPAKVTVVGVTDADKAMLHPRQYLFDVHSGEHWRTTDLVPDDPEDPSTRRFIETATYTDNGRAVLELAPGKDWMIYVSRGIEYSVERLPVNLTVGQTKEVAVVLKREVETPGYVGADFHLHASPSLDSDLSLDERVRSVVGEGVEVLVSTDHNFITDYAPTITDLQLEAWANSMIGLELTTLESGHFNGYPLRREVGAMTKGAFEWSLQPPDTIFDTIRSLGELGPEQTIVQVNHPRDSILGYFEQYGVDPLTGSLPEPVDCTAPLLNPAACIIPPNGSAFRTADGLSTFSYGFDAIEVLNASVAGRHHHARMPASIDGLDVPDELRQNPPDEGAILCDGDSVAAAGAADDWFNMLNLGHKFLGTGTSDSHDADDHPGAGRTFVYIGSDDPGRATSEAVVKGLKSGRAIMTTGPFVEATINDLPIGSTIERAGSEVTLKVKVQAASWVDVDQGIVWVNGHVRERFPIQLTEGRFRFVTNLTIERDSWVVIEVTGDSSMFPIYRPVDLPPVLIGDALASFADILGFGGDALGDLQPKLTGQHKPIALTNPIWIDVDGDADGDGEIFEAPGNLPGECDGFQVVYDKSIRFENGQVPSLMQPKPKVTSSYGLPRFKGDILDVRTIFEQFGRHNH
ncbi:MAG: CehA/McbA family metallohydrolase [Bradymonadia bacterium]